MGFLSWNTAGMIPAGLAVQNAAGKIEVVKAKGRLRVLSEMTDEGKAVQGCCGHRAYPLGNPRRTQRGERTPALQPRPENWQLCITALLKITRN